MTYTPPQPEPSARLADVALRKRRGVLIAVAACGALVLAAIAGGASYALTSRDSRAKPAAAASANSVPSPSTEAATAVSATGPGSARAACVRLAEVTSGTPTDNFVAADLPALKSAGELAAASDSLSIATNGQLLADTVADAIAAQGQGDEATRSESVKKYVRNLRKSCAIAGFPT